MLDKLAPAAEETARETAEDCSQASIDSRYIALQIDAIERGTLARAQD